MIALLWGAILALIIGVGLLMSISARINREWGDISKREHNISLIRLSVAIIFIALVMITAYLVSVRSEKSRAADDASAPSTTVNVGGPQFIPRPRNVVVPVGYD